MFCGAPKPSKEHVLGKWLKRFAGDNTIEAFSRHTVSRIDMTPRPGLLDRPGAPLNQTTRVVCETCNNTWMSGIEATMSESFSKLHEQRFNHLNEHDWDAIERWLTLKALIAARWQYDQPLAEGFELGTEIGAQIEAERKKFFATPHQIDQEVIIFRCDRNDIWGAHNYLSNFVLNKEAREIMHLQSMWLGLGSVILLSISHAWRKSTHPEMMRLWSEAVGVPFYTRNTWYRVIAPPIIKHKHADELLRCTAGNREGKERFRDVVAHPRNN